MGIRVRRGLWQSAASVAVFLSFVLLGCGDSERRSATLGHQTHALAAPITVSFQNGVAPAATYVRNDRHHHPASGAVDQPG